MLKNMADGMNLKGVKFWGRVIEGVDVFFAAADYFVLPGVGGLSLNQALFWRLPCIVSEADGTEDDLVLDGKTGFRFTPMDLQSLEKALSRCLELPETTRLDFGNTGRRLVLERSNVNQMVNTFLRTIEQDAVS
jgi:glycosyltransferase involved in cell wall biosynthesis